MAEHELFWDYRNPYEWMRRVRTSSMPPLIICCAITGGMHGKELNPNLPETAEEQVEQAYEAYKAGASMVHVHVRNPNKLYECTGSAEEYRKVNGMIREKCPDIIINNTTGGGPGMSAAERMMCLDAGPEVASLNMTPDMTRMTFKERKPPLPHPRPEIKMDESNQPSYAEVAAFARRMKERGVKAEFEMFQPGAYWVVQDIISQGLVEKPYLVQLVMGGMTGIYPTPWNLLALLQELPQPCVFEVAGMGPYQLPMTVASIMLGGHVRVGMEDNVYLSKGRLLKSNAEIVERIARIAHDMNRDVATPRQARQMIGISETPSKY
jgi:3-keto-5-aminohexanoate cleavage enzyme